MNLVIIWQGQSKEDLESQYPSVIPSIITSVKMSRSQQKLVMKLRLYFWLWICVRGHLNSTRCSITVIQNVSQPNQSTKELNEEENIQITFPIFWFPKRHSESASKVYTTPTEISLNEAKLVERILNTALHSSALFMWMPHFANGDWMLINVSSQGHKQVTHFT